MFTYHSQENGWCPNGINHPNQPRSIPGLVMTHSLLLNSWPSRNSWFTNLPTKAWWIFPSFFVCLPEGNSGKSLFLMGKSTNLYWNPIGSPIFTRWFSIWIPIFPWFSHGFSHSFTRFTQGLAARAPLTHGGLRCRLIRLKMCHAIRPNGLMR